LIVTSLLLYEFIRDYKEVAIPHFPYIKRKAEKNITKIVILIKRHRLNEDLEL
jgi:hypothetical protein